MPRRYALIFLLVTGPVLAQTPIPGNCELGRAQADLNISDVLSRMFNTGSLFFGNTSQAAYVVPRMTGRSPMFAAGIWVGGLIGGDLRVAGATYADFEFWPGPLDPATGRPPDPDDCSAYDRIWVVSTRDVESYDGGGPPSPDLADWPVHLGAEVVDGDGVPGNYNLAGGDRPRIYGTQTAFWVMNDVGNVHMNTHVPPMGLEVRVHAFAVVSASDILNRATVYRYTLVNRNSLPFEDAYFSIYGDPDLGDPSDDFIGSDIARSLGYVYNADDQDGDGTGSTYGTPPPAVGFDLLSEKLGSFMFFAGGPPPTADPNSGEQIYWVQQGRWTDGLTMTVGGNGYNVGSTDTTTFAFPADPVPPAFWSERCPGSATSCGWPLTPGDRRMVVSSPVFTLAAGASRTFDVALLFGLGVDHLNSVSTLREVSDIVQTAFVSGALFATVQPLGSLPAPSLLTPSEGQYVGAGPTTFVWDAVPGAEGYVVEVWPVADSTGRALSPSAGASFLTGAASIEVPGCGRPNHLSTCAWRVRADAPSAGAVGFYSQVRTFRMQQFVAGLLDGGGSIVETANPSVAPCPDPGDFGCENYAGEGNSLFRDPNRTDDFDISSTNGTALGLHNTTAAGGGFSRTASPFDYEIRFTPGGGYAVYNAFLGAATVKRIAQVPFEVWNVGTTPDDPSDDVRMIPVLRQNSTAEPMVVNWQNSFRRLSSAWWTGIRCNSR